jgi:hypothetical protein
MPIFTIPLTPVGASVQTVITPSPTDEKSEGRELSIRGIVDTGAAFTCIDNSVAQLLGLEPVEKQLIHGITTGAKPVPGDIYRINVRIYAPGTNELGYCVRNIMAYGGDLFRMWVDGSSYVRTGRSGALPVQV